MNLQYISDNLINQSSIGLPILCFSITDSTIHITTKKVASRFFEHLTTNTKYIEFRVKNRISCSTEEITNGIEFYDYILLYFESNSIITTSQLFEILNIQNIQEITSELFLQKWNLIVVTRDPIIRLLSGFVELSDSMLDNDNIDNIDIYNMINSNLIQSQSNNTPFGLKNFKKEEANQILNYFSKNIEHIITTDEHTSNWNTFVSYLLTKCKGKFQILDIDDSNDMKEYGSTETNITNKHIYTNWLEDDVNRTHILKFLHKLNYFLVTDYINYIKIKSLK